MTGGLVVADAVEDWSKHKVKTRIVVVAERNSSYVRPTSNC